jgi:hypothetical protein
MRPSAEAKSRRCGSTVAWSYRLLDCSQCWASMMPPDPSTRKAGPKARHRSLTAKIDSLECSAGLEAIVFLDGARQWLDHAARGDIGIIEAAVAAQLLLARAETLALAA